MGYSRTPEHRALRAQLIRQLEPWKKSSGPKTPQGKKRVSQNAFKGGLRRELRVVRQALHEQDQMLKDVKV